MLVRTLFIVLAIAAAIAHGYRFRHYKKKLEREIDGLAEDLSLKGGGPLDRRKTIRQKRVSDQRLAELEALVALSNMKGNMKSIPYGFGTVDPRKIGRKRRSSPSSLLDRLLESIAREESEAEERGETGEEALSQARPALQWSPYYWSQQQPE